VNGSETRRHDRTGAPRPTEPMYTRLWRPLLFCVDFGLRPSTTKHRGNSP
jgi:hypothetical protein